MVQLLKLIFLALRELIFDSKEEYDYKSSRFNTRKFILLIVICLSLTANVWVVIRFVSVATDLIALREEYEQCLCQKPNVTSP